MAEQSAQEKTEKATPRKLRKARERGEVAQSKEVHSALVLFMGLFSLLLFREQSLMAWRELIRSLSESIPELIKTHESLVSVFGMAGQSLGRILLPLFLAVVIAAFLGTWGQVGIIFSTESLKLKLERLNPFAGFKRIFSERIVSETFKALFKMTGFMVITIYNLLKTMEGSIGFLERNTASLMMFMVELLWRIAFHTLIFMGTLSMIDFVIQKRQMAKKLRMTKKEVKDENKEVEGNPQVKSKIRNLMRKLASGRMMNRMPDAAVVITNPQHLAVALEYKPDMKAPKVLVKGAGLMAQRIKDKAKEFDVPIVENKALARLLYRWVEPGDEVPASLYQAVAEVLAYVFRVKRRTHAFA